MRLILNILWVVLAGFWLFLGYVFAGLLACLTIIGIPFGFASFRIGVYSLWPFGRTVVKQQGKGIGSTLGNIIWFILGGWWLALLHLLTGVLLFVTIIGIPLALGNFKLINVCIRPFGREIVSLEHAQRVGLEPASVISAQPRTALPPGA
jgi:uncharacterized membrane protein YccF (DUF307 family)